MFLKSGAYMEKDAHSRALLNISFGVFSKGTLPSGPYHGVPAEKDVPLLEPSFIHHSKSLVYEPHPWFVYPQTKRGPYGERCPYPEPFLTYLQGSPVKEHSIKDLRSELLQREWSPILRAPFIHLSKFPGPDPHPRYPTGSIYGETPIPESPSTHKPSAYESSTR